jgi:hypothetical protein
MTTPTTPHTPRKPLSPKNHPHLRPTLSDAHPEGFVRPFHRQVRQAAKDKSVDTRRLVHTTVAMRGSPWNDPEPNTTDLPIRKMEHAALYLVVSLLDGDGETGGWINVREVLWIFRTHFQMDAKRTIRLLRKLILYRVVEYARLLPPDVKRTAMLVGPDEMAAGFAIAERAPDVDGKPQRGPDIEGLL